MKQRIHAKCIFLITPMNQHLKNDYYSFNLVHRDSLNYLKKIFIKKINDWLLKSWLFWENLVGWMGLIRYRDQSRWSEPLSSATSEASEVLCRILNIQQRRNRSSRTECDKNSEFKNKCLRDAVMGIQSPSIWFPLEVTDPCVHTTWIQERENLKAKSLIALIRLFMVGGLIRGGIQLGEFSVRLENFHLHN